MSKRMRVLVAATIATLAIGTSAVAAPTNDYANRLARLDDLQRRAALRGAVVNSGQRCRRVELAEPRGALRNLTMWAVRCAPGGDFGLFIGPDGSVQVRTCADLATLRLPTCRLPAATAQAAPAKR
jgi:hypothetical protein